MTTVEKIEQEISKLTPRELAQFRAWYSDFDSDAWDGQIAQDLAAGKLDALADVAFQSHKAGQTKAL